MRTAVPDTDLPSARALSSHTPVPQCPKKAGKPLHFMPKELERLSSSIGPERTPQIHSA